VTLWKFNLILFKERNTNRGNMPRRAQNEFLFFADLLTEIKLI